MSNPVDVAGFHNEATRLLATQVSPEAVRWSAAPAQSVGQEALHEQRAAIHNRAARAIIPQSFIRISELVVLHRDPQRFSLLYRALWRLVYEPELRHDLRDHDLARLRQMAQAVRRDIQKMKSRLEFRPLPLRSGTAPVAWYEPAHHVSETVAAWLANRDAATRWVLLTPDRSLRWDGDRLLSAPALAPHRQPGAIRTQAEWVSAVEALRWV